MLYKMFTFFFFLPVTVAHRKLILRKRDGHAHIAVPLHLQLSKCLTLRRCCNLFSLSGSPSFLHYLLAYRISDSTWKDCYLLCSLIYLEPKTHSTSQQERDLPYMLFLAYCIWKASAFHTSAIILPNQIVSGFNFCYVYFIEKISISYFLNLFLY